MHSPIVTPTAACRSRSPTLTAGRSFRPARSTSSGEAGWSPSDIKIKATDGYPYADHFAASNFTRGIVTFHTGYLFRTSPGWQLMATGPFNEPKHGIAPLTGLIETDWLPYPFTMNWQLTAPGKVHFEKGEPVCLIFPVPQGALNA